MRIGCAWMSLGALLAMACGGAMEEPSEDDAEELGVLHSALIIPTGSQSQHSCTGYTSGGGQRVDGALLLSAPFSLTVDGVTGDYVNLDLWATNYKRNIGWSKKPTGQLSIDLTVDGETGTFDTGGETVSQIRGVIAFPYVADVGPRIEVTFHGRDGSSCSL